MAKRLTQIATKLAKLNYQSNWNVAESLGGVEVSSEISPGISHQIFYKFLRDDILGLRVQPGVGVTFAEVNTARDRLIPRHAYTVDGATGFVLLNSIIPSGEKNLAGWVIERNENFESNFTDFLHFVDRKIDESNFFSSLLSLEDYINSVRTGRWGFVTVHPTFLYALMAVGEKDEAKKIATFLRKEALKEIAERGLVFSEMDTLPYDQIINCT